VLTFMQKYSNEVLIALLILLFLGTVLTGVLVGWTSRLGILPCALITTGVNLLAIVIAATLIRTHIPTQWPANTSMCYLRQGLDEIARDFAWILCVQLQWSFALAFIFSANNMLTILGHLPSFCCSWILVLFLIPLIWLWSSRSQYQSRRSRYRKADSFT